MALHEGLFDDSARSLALSRASEDAERRDRLGQGGRRVFRHSVKSEEQLAAEEAAWEAQMAEQARAEADGSAERSRLEFDMRLARDAFVEMAQKRALAEAKEADGYCPSWYFCQDDEAKARLLIGLPAKAGYVPKAFAESARENLRDQCRQRLKALSLDQLSDVEWRLGKYGRQLVAGWIGDSVQSLRDCQDMLEYLDSKGF